MIRAEGTIRNVGRFHAELEIEDWKAFRTLLQAAAQKKLSGPAGTAASILLRAGANETTVCLAAQALLPKTLLPAANRALPAEFPLENVRVLK